MDEPRVSSFVFLGSRITHFDFDSTIFAFEDNAFDKTIDIKIETKKPLIENNNRVGEVELRIEINLNSKDSSSDRQANIHLTISGGFQAPVEMEENGFADMLRINGAAALYSIARSYLISVTSQSFVRGNIILPLVNFLPETKE